MSWPFVALTDAWPLRRRIRPHVAVKHPLGLALADQAVVSACNFLLGVLVLRFQGVASYGSFVLAWLVVLFFAALQQSLIIAPMLSLMPKAPVDRRPHELSTYWWQQLGFGLLAALITATGTLVYRGVSGDARLNGLSAALTVAVFSTLLHDFVRRALFATSSPVLALAADLGGYGAPLAGIALLSATGKLSISGIIVTVAACQFASAVAALATLPLAAKRWSEIWQSARHAWQFSRWLTASSLTQWFASNVFVVAVGATVGEAGVGVLRAAQNIMGMAHVLFLALENYLPVRAAALFATQGRVAMLRFAARATRYGLALTGAVALVVGVMPAWWLRTVYGVGADQHAYVLTWFAALYIAVFIGTMLRIVLRTLEATGAFFVASAVTAAFSSVAAYPMVNAWGLLGAMAGLTVAQGISLVTFSWALYRTSR